MPTPSTAGVETETAVADPVPLLHRGQLRLLGSLSVCPHYLSEVLYADALVLVNAGLAALIACPSEFPGAGRRWRCEITPDGRRFLAAGP